jgi:hypothetical protein
MGKSRQKFIDKYGTSEQLDQKHIETAFFALSLPLPQHAAAFTKKKKIREKSSFLPLTLPTCPKIISAL